MKEKKKKRKKKRRTISLSSDSDDTVNYSVVVPQNEGSDQAKPDTLGVVRQLADDRLHSSENRAGKCFDQSGDRKLSCDSLEGGKSTIVNQSEAEKKADDLPSHQDNGESLRAEKQNYDTAEDKNEGETRVKTDDDGDSKFETSNSQASTSKEECDSGYETKFGDKSNYEKDCVSGQPTKKYALYKNIFTEKPEVHRAEFECLCGASTAEVKRGRKKRRLHLVQCSVCSLWQHAECVNYDVKDPYRGEFKCPHCHAASVSTCSCCTYICKYLSCYLAKRCSK